MVLKKKKKGAISLFTGIAVLFVSIVFLGIFIYFSMNYYGSLEDSQRMRNNKDNLAIISGALDEISRSGVGSFKEININPTDAITIDHIESNITITQEIRNQRNLENLRDTSNIGNLEIIKQESSILYVLDYNGLIIFSETINIMDSLQRISFEKTNEIDGVSVILIKNQEIFLEGTKIYSPVDNITYFLGDPITFKAIVTNTLQDYDCQWESDIDGLLSEICEDTITEISLGEHTITFKAKRDGETISTRRINITIAP